MCNYLNSTVNKRNRSNFAAKYRLRCPSSKGTLSQTLPQLMTGQVCGEERVAAGADLRLHSEQELMEPGCNPEQSRQREHKNPSYTHTHTHSCQRKLGEHYRPGICSQMSTQRLASSLSLLLRLTDSSCRPCACCEIIFSYSTNDKIQSSTVMSHFSQQPWFQGYFYRVLQFKT